MPLNPLDWPAEPFLTLYVSVVGVALLLVLALRSRARTASDPSGRAIVDPVELAWLAGGRRRAADTVLVAFLEAGAAVRDGNRFTVDTNGKPLPASVRAFAGPVAEADSAMSFRRLIQPALDQVQAVLAQRGLVPAPDQIARLKARTQTLFGIALALGLAKCVVGLERGRPIGFLVILLLVTLGITIWLIRNPPFRTRAGERAAREASRLRSRVARAPEDGEMVMAFALSGAAVLAGRDYASLMQPSGRSDGGSGCGGGGSSDSGGGDSGGSSGCGGCGGGGGGC